MSMEIAAALAPASSAVHAGGAPVQVGYGVSLSDLSGFQQALASAGARLEAQPVAATSEAAKQLLKPLEQINNEAVKLSADANAAQAGGESLSPGEIVALTVRSTEFAFHCQLTANIANRTSDGLQQLFRQQS
jgi:hypothetical protein